MPDNVTKRFTDCKIIGEIKFQINEAGIDVVNNRIDIKAPIMDIFYDMEGPTDYKSIIANESAFTIKLLSGVKPISSFIALVTDLIHYNVIHSENNDDQVKLTFEYKKLSIENLIPEDMMIVEPKLENLFVNGDYLAAFFTGDVDYIVSSVCNKLRVFSHGNKLYYAKMWKTLTFRVDEDAAVEPVKIGVIMLASTKNLPVMEDLYKHYTTYSKIHHLDDYIESFDEFLTGALGGKS